MTKDQKRIVGDKRRELQSVVGKRLLGFELKPFIDGDSGSVGFNPVLVFEDGTLLRFRVQEMDEWEDGVTPYIAEVN